MFLNILPGSDRPVPFGFAVYLSEKSLALADIKDDYFPGNIP